MKVVSFYMNEYLLGSQPELVWHWSLRMRSFKDYIVECNEWIEET